MIKAFVHGHNAKLLCNPKQMWAGYSVTPELINLNNTQVPAKLLMLPLPCCEYGHFFRYFRFVLGDKFYSIQFYKEPNCMVCAELAVDRITMFIR